jgi:hypothetical protein
MNRGKVNRIFNNLKLFLKMDIQAENQFSSIPSYNPYGPSSGFISIAMTSISGLWRHLV